MATPEGRKERVTVKISYLCMYEENGKAYTHYIDTIQVVGEGIPNQPVFKYCHAHCTNARFVQMTNLSVYDSLTE